MPAVPCCASAGLGEAGSGRRSCIPLAGVPSATAPHCRGSAGSQRRPGRSPPRAPQVVQEVVGFLHRLATASKDCAVVMCRVGTREALSKALDKHGTAPALAPALLDLVIDCEKYASLYKKLTTSILAGCIQVGPWHPGAALCLLQPCSGRGEEDAGPPVRASPRLVP